MKPEKATTDQKREMKKIRGPRAAKMHKSKRIERKLTDNRKQHNSDLKGRFVQLVKNKKEKKRKEIVKKSRAMF